MKNEKLYDVVELKSGQISQFGRIEIDKMLKHKNIYYHHTLNIFCYTKI